MSDKEKPRCCVADALCESASNWDEDCVPSRLPKCFRCGDYVCNPCSVRRKYIYAGMWMRVRLCFNCVEELDGNRENIERLIQTRMEMAEEKK